MQKVTHSSLCEEPPLPAQLFKLYRIRTRLTQPQLAALLRLKNKRMIHSWESGYHLPGPQRLQKLSKIYLWRDVFLPRHRQEEAAARQLGDSVKTGFETGSPRSEHFPRFDKNWFEKLQRQRSDLKGLPAARPAEVAAIIHPNPASTSLNLTHSFPSKPQDNLPTSPNRFIGRENELTQALALLAQKTTRLLTFTGTGGTGKTRLALEAANRLRQHYSAGIWLVELASLADPRFVIQAVAEVLGIREVADRPLVALVRQYLQTRQLLLVLDNCEHLVEECARLAQGLIQTCSGLQILATSREALNIPAEISLEIAGLSLSSPNPASASVNLEETEMGQSEAASFFVERARAVQPDFSLKENEAAILEICQRFDGLPLALELAAAQVKVLGTKQIAERLYQLPLRGNRAAQPRQQTIRASIDWSYNLLSRQEQELLQRLVVFRGGWWLEAVEKVCSGEDLQAFEMLELLSQLVNKSLVVAYRPRETGEVRYRLLETIRQYSEEKAQARETYHYHYRHALFYLDFIEKAVPKLLGEQQGEWLFRLEHEQDNLRMALGWLLEQTVTAATPPTSGFNEDSLRAAFFPQLPELALRLAGAMWRIWYTQGRITEGRHWLDAALLITPANPGQEIATVRAKVLRDAANFAWLQGEGELSRSLAQESIELYRVVGDKTGRAYALISLATALMVGNHYAKASSLFKESQLLFEELSDLRGKALTPHNLGWVALLESDYQRAIPLLQQSLQWFGELGDAQGAAHTLQNLGRALAFQGDYERAVILLEEGLSLARKVKAVIATAQCLQTLGEVALLQYQDYRHATNFLQESLKIAYELGLKDFISSNLQMLAWAALLMNLPERVARLGGAAQRLHLEIGNQIVPCELPRYEQTLQQARSQLPVKVFEALWKQGYELSLEQAIRYALEPISLVKPESDPPLSPAASVSALPLPVAKKMGLTSREIAVLELVVQGLTNIEIAEKLSISPHTVNSHLTSIYAKLEVSSRVEAIRYCLQHHLL
jgi:non-specific serine/threonine protein kinase